MSKFAKSMLILFTFLASRRRNEHRLTQITRNICISDKLSYSIYSAFVIRYGNFALPNGDLVQQMLYNPFINRRDRLCAIFQFHSLDGVRSHLKTNLFMSLVKLAKYNIRPRREPRGLHRGQRGQRERELKDKRVGFWSACIGWVPPSQPLTGAVPLLPHACALSCSVTRLARFAPP